MEGEATYRVKLQYSSSGKQRPNEYSTRRIDGDVKNGEEERSRLGWSRGECSEIGGEAMRIDAGESPERVPDTRKGESESGRLNCRRERESTSLYASMRASRRWWWSELNLLMLERAHSTITFHSA
ncbi:hypothetical protein PNOK_0793200 [Pyrrhoderma noxium]|uniref:Uncharacterized protein n=1 Tax=Pyrrhoderma noxium TaxID=2282107 RepID=A0A286U9P9_9AGAM|nr:hypothetical protein PNOK_0793200 [Pyrrhoderma noxium]